MALIFIHSGYSTYLEFTLRQARAAAPEADVILLGDAENDRFPFLRHVDVTRPSFQAAAERVAGVYRHRSTNAPLFELRCFQRWFVLQAFLEAEGLDDAFVLDSDVMLYAPEAELVGERLAGKTLALARPLEQPAYHWVTSAHVSYWTAAQVEAFCAFVLRSYTEPPLFARYEEKWQHHLRNGLYGGICDMTALHLFEQEQAGGDVANLLTVHDGTAHDLSAGVAENAYPEEYRMRGGIKEMTWDERGRPSGHNLRLGVPVRFQTLHLQGKAKASVPLLYRGPSFPGQARLRRQITWHYRMRRVASAVVQPTRFLRGKLKRRTP